MILATPITAVNLILRISKIESVQSVVFHPKTGNGYLLFKHGIVQFRDIEQLLDLICCGRVEEKIQPHSATHNKP